MRTQFLLSLVVSVGLAGSAIAQNSFGQVPSGGGFGGGQQPGFGGVQQPGGGGFGNQQPGFAGQQPPPGGGNFGGQQPGGGGFGGQQPGGGGSFAGQQPPGGGNFGGGQQPPGGGGGMFGGGVQQPPAGGGGGQQPQFAAMLDQLAQYEMQDFGVPASQQLHSGQMHGPTPASIPGGRLATTKDIVQLVQSGQQYLLFDVLGSGQTMPGAIPAVEASYPGDYNDQISQQMRGFLQQATQGNTQVPLIFYCASVQCWMSYNASLRAINLGYTNVLWYRGGLQAWQQIGGPVQQAGGGFGGQQPQQPQQPGGGGFGRN